MAAVPVTLIGAVTYDNGTTQNVTFSGVAAIAGVGVGGGPMPGGGDGGGGGTPGSPTHPIWGPPGSNFPNKPGYPPVAGWPGGGPGGDHVSGGPIIPPAPTEPPNPPEDKLPPDGGGGWGYWADAEAWVYQPKEGQEASPKG